MAIFNLITLLTSENPKGYYKRVYDHKYLLQGLTKPDYLMCYISGIVTLAKNSMTLVTLGLVVLVIITIINKGEVASQLQ